jgi:hypothetical protein
MDILSLCLLFCAVIGVVYGFEAADCRDSGTSEHSYNSLPGLPISLSPLILSLHLSKVFNYAARCDTVTPVYSVDTHSLYLSRSRQKKAKQHQSKCFQEQYDQD